MRIAIISETFLPATDGVVTRLRHTLEELNALGDEVMVVAPVYPGEENPKSYAGAFVHRVPGIPFPPYPEIKLSPTNPSVGRALKRFRPDLLHAVNPFILGIASPYYAKKLGIPMVASYHTNVAEYTRFYGLPFLYNLTRFYTRTIHNMAAVNLCTSQATLGYLRSEGIERVRLWPQGVDARLYNPDRRTDEMRRRLSGGRPDSKLLVFVGRLAPEKGIGRLKTILHKVPDTRLAVVGDGPARKALEKEFAGEPVVFTGRLSGEELASAYASGDAFVFPSTTETLGMAMIEGLASGLPVIAARSGASSEVVREGVDGLLYEAGNPRSLVESVRRMFEEDGLRERLARGARDSAENRSWTASTETVRGYYGEALAMMNAKVRGTVRAMSR
ncbi:glycosyltransferase family 4 protein [Rubrobacter indicoceani]|uniref:glycosyltransferase family 4 protein n=1 Tax=Rubrobacter indicoceani TaxID=2051957 RepID=UPI000E5BED59|nr:glycosyltransferase family 1 protein [Rubrobacter indicoceani]